MVDGFNQRGQQEVQDNRSVLTKHCWMMIIVYFISRTRGPSSSSTNSQEAGGHFQWGITLTENPFQWGREILML